MVEKKEEAMAIITINGNDIKKFIEEFSVKFARMEMVLETLSKEFDLLKKQIFEKQAENGKQDISLAQIKTVCEQRGKIIDELVNFKNRFLFSLIAGNILTLGLAFLIFRIFK